MLHSTGANNPFLKRYIQPNDGQLGFNNNGNHWNRSGVQLCVHAFIGKLANGSVATYQTLPWNHRAWHCGGSGNDSYISFEICEDALKDRNYFNLVYKEAVEFTAYLCKLHNFNPLKDGVVICHKEGYRRGIASNHSDVEHWFTKFGKTMNDFRNDVAKEMKGDDIVTQAEFDKMLENWLARQAKKPANSYSKQSYADAKAQGVTDGSRPQSFATREEVITMIQRAIK